MKETYRFWSLDSLYIGITKKVIREQGVNIKKDDFRQSWLYHGSVFEWGKAPGRSYPDGSHPHQPKPRKSYPTTLEIITSSSGRLVHLEQELKIGKDIPRGSQRELRPSEEWDARPISER